MAFIEQGPLLVILIVVLLLFGAAAIPKLARSLGRAKGEFQRAKEEFDAASATGAAEAAPASDEQLRQTARSLGIDPEGKTSDELKLLIQQKVA